MVNDLVWLVARINLVLAAAIVLVLLARGPVRRMFGARVAYALWLLPPLTAAMVFAPARVVHMVLLEPPSTAAALVSDHTPWLLLFIWGAGALASLAVLALRQLRFTLSLGRLAPRDDLGLDVLAAESTTHGPAVIGVIRPVIVTPADFDKRFDAEEQDIVLAHERAHLAQGDPWINAFVLLVQCVNWFNPLVHLGARALRVDQELACDAAVLSQAQGARRRYAETMLKTQIAAAVPIGCAWPPSNLDDLKERIAMLKRTLPTRGQSLAGVCAIGLATAGACAAAWAAQPARVVASVAPALPAPGFVIGPPEAIIPISADANILVGDTGTLSGDVLMGEDLAGGQSQDGDDHADDGGLVIRRAEDLTPEERAQIRAAVAQARRAAHDARRQAMEAQSSVNHEEIRRAVEEARAARHIVDSAEIQAAIARARSENRVVVMNEADISRVRESVRVQELARAQAREARQLGLSQARAAVAQAEAEARAANDAVRADALERARISLDAAQERAEHAREHRDRDRADRDRADRNHEQADHDSEHDHDGDDDEADDPN